MLILTQFLKLDNILFNFKYIYYIIDMVNDMKEKNIFISIVEILLLVTAVAYFVITIFFIEDNKIFHLISAALLSSGLIIRFIENVSKKKSLYKILFSFIISAFVIFNILHVFGFFYENKTLFGDFYNTSINNLLSFAEQNNITVEQSYEYSDTVEEFNIISQSVFANTELTEVTSVRIVVSLGPNYDKEVIVPNLIGQTINDLLLIKKELFLNNIVVNYETSDQYAKDVIIDQSFKGQCKRNTLITFTISLGSEVLETNMISLKDMSLFDATLWLKQNGIKYNLTYEFNDVKRNYIVSQDIQEGTSVNSSMTINLIVSKGKSITVPNLLDMTSDEVINWIIDNELKIEFSDSYDTAIPLGKIISANYNEGDIIEVQTLVKIVTSKGQLLFPGFTSLNDFRTWASKNSINYNEEYQMSTTVAKGNIISFSVGTSAIIDVNSNITVYVSSGRPVTVPNFYGQSQSNITNTCNNIGLTCAFYESGYSSVSAGSSIGQSIKSGVVVVEATYLSIGLSKGPAQNFTVQINQSSIQSCIGNSDCTINYLRQLFANNYPGVTVNFVLKTSSVFQFAGNIHEDSAIKDGSLVTQGKTYTITITKS